LARPPAAFARRESDAPARRAKIHDFGQFDVRAPAAAVGAQSVLLLKYFSKKRDFWYKDQYINPSGIGLVQIIVMFRNKTHLEEANKSC
jgi:hypothetical protein